MSLLPSRDRRRFFGIGVTGTDGVSFFMEVACCLKIVVPIPPPLPDFTACQFLSREPRQNHGCPLKACISVPLTSRELLDRLFDQAYEADVRILTEGGGTILGHAGVLGLASSVMKGKLNRSKRKGRWRSITLHGVPPDAVRVFIRFLYSSCYEDEEVRDFVMPLLVLSHVFVIPQLKRICEQQIEHSQLNLDNLIDVFQLSLLCDASRLGFICHRMISNNFEEVMATEGWKAMKQSHPLLEKQLLNLRTDDQHRRKERVRRMDEKKIYLLLYEAMEALVHICREGCRTIGPYNKVFKEGQPPCGYKACKGLESLVRHFAGCKMRVPGGCVQCRRMWQIFELHSRLCADSDACKVPLCRNLKERIKKLNKKDEMKWRILVRNILRSKTPNWVPLFQATIAGS
ncbi:hypothetical protein MLD38_008128 [Melastoma candidum]|uniref:Uncharacterized protein n=1 Tax=Melastoma candidum TaxID=119954 RepID=A0ACB9RUK3_9MYRT|nr:hypothetical protein MLD38_008128 [Melastoma candidum]